MAYNFDAKTWSFTDAPTPHTLRVPTLLVMPLAALMGLTFMMFLPVVGFALTGHALIRRLRS
jgi:hypothetical protein